jgi:hypothetical protein
MFFYWPAKAKFVTTVRQMISASNRSRKSPDDSLPPANAITAALEREPRTQVELASQNCPTTSLPSAVCDRTLAPCTGSAANSTKTRRKSLSRRLVESVGQQEVRQRGYVYQKNRTQSEKWIPTERAYGRYRVDVPGEPGQREVRVALGFCRDRMSALLKLQNAMNQAGVLDAAKLRERITSTTTFAQQAEWMIAEMKAGRIVNTKTRERIGDRTIGFYSSAV